MTGRIWKCAALSAGLALGSVVSTPAWGQSDSGLAQESDPLKQLIEEITQQLDHAERERLADPWWLRDMRGVLAKYDWPWRRPIFSDDFSGQGPGPDAPWQVTAGEMLIDWRHGLRSVIEPRGGTSQGSGNAQGEDENGDAVSQLFGQILQQTLQGSQNQQQASPQQSRFAAATLPVPVTNAFAITLDLTARPSGAQGATRLEFGPYQGQSANYGYRLVYNGGGQSPALELLQMTSRGTTTLYLYNQPVNLEDERPHRFIWTRDRNGAMQISLDGAPVMDLVDRAFAQPFDGFAVVNGGGDFALRSLAIDGTE